MLPKSSVKRPYTVIVAVILVLVLGAVSFMNLKTDLLPNLELPYVVIMTVYPGASPEEVEVAVTRPIEQAVSTINDVKNVESTSNENQSMVIIEFNSTVNMDSAIIEISSNLDMVKAGFNDYVQSPMVMRLNPDMLPIMVSSVDIEGKDTREISKIVNEEIIPQFESVAGVASVTGQGLIEENVEIMIDQSKIDNLNSEILKKVDAKLAETESSLNDGKKEIENGLAQIDTEREQQLTQINLGLETVVSAKTEINKAEESINNGLQELYSNKKVIVNSIDEIDNQLDKLKIIEAALIAGGGTSPEYPGQTLDSIRAQKDILEAQKTELRNSLDTINDKISELDKQSKEIQNQKMDLIAQEANLNNAKLALTTQLDNAKTNLLNAQKELDEGYAEFEKAREDAFKQASLDGVITKDMISQILSAQNFSMPAGYVSDEDQEYVVKIGDKLSDIEEIKNLLLFDTGDDMIGKIYLSDVAEINMLNNLDENYTKVNNNDAVMLTMQKQSDYSTSEVAKGIRDKMEEISAKDPSIHFTPLLDQGIYIDIVINSVLDNIIYGGILAIFVLFIFLRDIRPTLIIALAIPISIVFAIALMYFGNISLNVISLAGLALGVGMLVDNSIVAIENIYRLRGEGYSSIKASVIGANEIAGAITASTLTTAVVFLPIVFTQGISRQLFTDMGLTIAFSLFASLLVALTLVPTMSSTILAKSSSKESKLFYKFINIYEKILRWTLKRKAIVLIVVALLLALSGVLSYSKGTEFIPAMESPQMLVTLDAPSEYDTDEVKELGNSVVAEILNLEGIDTVGAFLGGIQGFGQNTNQISLYVLLDEESGVKNSEIKAEIEKIANDMGVKLNVSESNMDISAIAGSGMEIIVKGPELDTLNTISEEVMEVMNSVEGISNVSNGLDDQNKEINITVNKELAMENNLTVAQVYAQISNIISTPRAATTLSNIQDEYPVIVVESASKNFTRSDLENLELEITNSDDKIKLTEIATITESDSMNSINRSNQSRYISVTGDIKTGYNIGILSREIEQKLDQINVPDGYAVQIAGQQELITSSMQDLVNMLILAIIFVYLIMVAQFQSLLLPFIVMFTVPLAFTGGLFALYFTNKPISLIAMLGLLILTGVVVNNGIVFVDYTNQLRDKGLEKKEALVLAGKTRMRPILMTAITTILGLITLSFGVGMGAEILQPLALVVVGGLSYATILTLFVVPCMYDILVRDKRRKVAELEEELNEI
ncbi:acriflavin resistance protein [Soehngenia longivitae]|uniref:Acriflavin resistance protein n=1 Tax=Soehngenia longivitae TaxID=2562294 RepID=A0A4Z0D778_9FIRM|nr:efflux RND transporter permease subunit [Soehngenia longivitae]TFZ40748.1 acriflavin resistance protein [Soehngenia longivitae]